MDQRDNAPGVCGNLYSSRPTNSSVIVDTLAEEELVVRVVASRRHEKLVWDVWKLECSYGTPLLGKVRHLLSIPSSRKSIMEANWVRRAAGSPPPPLSVHLLSLSYPTEVIIKTIKIALCLEL